MVWSSASCRFDDGLDAGVAAGTGAGTGTGAGAAAAAAAGAGCGAVRDTAGIPGDGCAGGGVAVFVGGLL